MQRKYVFKNRRKKCQLMKYFFKTKLLVDHRQDKLGRYLLLFKNLPSLIKTLEKTRKQPERKPFVQNCLIAS
jgi:hypothetical protein